MLLPPFACFVQAADEGRLRAIAAFDDARLAVQERRVFRRDHLHFHFAALEQFVEALVSGPVHHAVDLVDTLVPLFLESRFTGEPRSRDVSRVQVAVADNLDDVDAFDLLRGYWAANDPIRPWRPQRRSPSLVDGVRAPLLATGSGWIEFQMPGDEPVGVANVVVSVAGSMSNTQSLDTWATTPVVLAVERSNGTVVAAGNPAAAGEIVTIYALGRGAVTPDIAIGGAVSANALSTTVLTPQLELGAVPMNVLFSGLAPGFVGL
jgi:hypothetical protein